MKILKHLLIALLNLIACLNINAQEFSYVYIQGDKQVPFYVKLEDNMMPRYGKNYCIIPQLAPGPITLQILFQQNVSDPQKFTINIPQNGYRGFMLLKKNNAYSLYDIHNQYYIRADNKIEEDTPPVNNPSIAYIPTNSNINTDKKTIASAKKSQSPAANKSLKAKPKQSTNMPPRFIENVELRNQHNLLTKQQSISTDSTEQRNTLNSQLKDNTIGVLNSDCPKAMNSDDFRTIQNKTIKKASDSRLKYLLTKLDECYNTSQVRLLTKTLTSDPERYTFLKKVYPRVTDQGTFSTLENLLSTEEWKSFFRSIIP